MDCDVLICGLGPVGQLLALLLGRVGVATITIDEAGEPYDLPRAAVVDDEVLRIFIPLRVAERAMRRQGAGAWEVDHALRMASYFAAGSDGATTDAVERLTGHAPRPLQTFLAENALAFGGTAAQRRATPLARILSLAPSLKGT